VTALDMGEKIGRIAELKCDGLIVSVMVLDGKQAYGSTRYLVEPVAGRESVWVDSSRVSFR